jgi:hypothetical protein
MDIDIEKKVAQAIKYLNSVAVNDVDFNHMDPLARMMLVALINEVQNVLDYVNDAEKRIVERFCTHFIPHEEVDAMPAITVLQLTFRKDAGIISVGNGHVFSYKTPLCKQPLNYRPLFKTNALPFQMLYVLTHQKLSLGNQTIPISMDKSNRVWVGINTSVEVESLQGLSMLIKGTNGIVPAHIYLGTESRELDMATMREMENIDMVEPFDAQQASGKFFSYVRKWKECLLNMDDATLLYITDTTVDRDLFKPKAYPKMFQQWLESNTLGLFSPSTLWLQIDFPEGYTVPDNIDIIINALPAVNIDMENLTLTQSSPIAKLQNKENAFFLRVVETSSNANKQGFNMTRDEIIIRDFDANCYNNGDLYRDVRNLYNRFIDDYYAFIEYNGIKDGEVLKLLRETINQMGKSVGLQNAKFNFDSGTYVMKNMNQSPQTSSTRVSYMTTMGKLGNEPKAGEMMENKKLPTISQKVPIVVASMGGANKATADVRYELLRYYSLTNDRLYTKMDIEAFLRKEIIEKFGKEEFKRIFIRISIEGAGGSSSIERGLYIDIEFKDKKNYDKALASAFDKLLKQKIEGRSCISMPINIQLICLEL